MTGGTDRHDSGALNAPVALREHLRGGPCRVYRSDVKSAIGEDEASCCPDVMVSGESLRPDGLDLALAVERLFEDLE